MSKLDVLRMRVAQAKSRNVPQVCDRVFAIDGSGSMGIGMKMQNAKEALKNHARPDDCILVFDDDVHSILYDDISAIIPGFMTAMLPCLRRAVEHRCKEIILISDGLPNKHGGPLDVIDYVASLKGIKIDTILLACEEAYEEDEERTQASALMQTVAETTGGRYNFVDDPTKLTKVVGLLCAPQIITS